MAILSDYEEVDQKKPSSSAVTKPFSAALDPSNPLGFLESVFEFVAKESDLFKSDSLVSDVNAVVRMVKDKVEGLERKRKESEKKAAEKKAAEKKAAEKKTAPPPVKKEEVVKAKEEVKADKEAESKSEEEAKGPRGMLNFSLLFFVCY